MQFSTKGRYGLRALADMALHSDNEGPLALRAIAARQEISESYLEQVFTSLRKAGLVRSIRGAQGGYELSRTPQEITVAEVLQALEGPIAPVQCVAKPNASYHCKHEQSCITRPFWEELNVKLNDYLNSVTLQDIIAKAPSNPQENPLYYI